MLFYTTDFDKSVTPEEKDHLLMCLKSFELTTRQGAAQAARSESGQSERYQACHEDGYTIQFIGIHANDATRLIAAVVTDGEERHHFALEITETHDYQKTLVDNETRLSNWKERLLQFFPYISSIKKATNNEPTARLETTVKIRHNKIIKLNPEQEAVDESPPEQITFCFGPPGTGKTLVVTGFLERCILAERPTLFMGPELKLIQFVQEALYTRLSEEQRQLAHFHSWHSFLTMLMKEADLPPQLIYNPTLKNETRLLVTSDVLYAHLCPSHTPPKQTKALLNKYSIDMLFQEYQHVLLQPIWKRPDCFFLSMEEYQSLGVTQSRIPKQDRSDIHTLLQAFFYKVFDQPDIYYDQVLATKHIYLHLLRVPFKKFGAIALDEAQRLNPLQIACLLSTSMIEEGYTLVTSDPLQNIDSQPLAFMRPLEDYFACNNLSHLLRLSHLETTHRSSIFVTQLTKIWRNILLTLVGPDEIKTFSQMRLDERQIMGKITVAQYNQNLKTIIESNPSAMVLVPNYEASNNAWATSHLTTINEFQGLSGKTIVLDGLSEVYQKELQLLSKQLEAEDNPFDLDTPIVPARHFKSDTPLPLEIIRAIKAFIIALSRAEEELILINPHPILLKMIDYLHQKYAPKSEAAASSSAIPTDTSGAMSQPKVYSTREWFNRCKKHINDQLIPQACDLLKRGDIWGEHTTSVNALGSTLAAPGADKHEIMRQMKAILFPAPITLTSQTAVAALSEHPPIQVSLPSTPPAVLENLIALWETTYKAKWMNFAATLIKNPSKTNLITFFELQDIALINCILFVNTSPLHNPLIMQCVNTPRHLSTLQNVLATNPERYCAKITIQGLISPIKQVVNTIEYTTSGLIELTQNTADVFLFIITHNPTLAGQINGNMLCAPYATFANQNLDFNRSVLINISSLVVGQNVFLKLLTQNVRLAKEITAKALLRINLDHMSMNSTPFDYLIETQAGAEILYILFKENPELISDSILAALCKKLTKLNEKNRKVIICTGIASLASSEKGLMILELLLESFINFTPIITTNALDTSSSFMPHRSLREILSTKNLDNPRMEHLQQKVGAYLLQLDGNYPRPESSFKNDNQHKDNATGHPPEPLYRECIKKTVQEERCGRSISCKLPPEDHAEPIMQTARTMTHTS